LNNVPSFLGKAGKLHHRSKPVFRIENGIQVDFFESARQASLKYNLCESSVAKSARTGCKAGEYYWRYI